MKQNEAQRYTITKEDHERRQKESQQRTMQLFDDLANKVSREIDAYTDRPYIDLFNQRWYKCKSCGKVGIAVLFGECGGEHGPAGGICLDCIQKDHR